MKRSSVRVAPNNGSSGEWSLGSDAPDSISSSDPNFDPDSEAPVKLGNYAPVLPCKSPSNPLQSHSSDDIKSIIIRAALDYLVSYDKDDFVVAIQEITHTQTAHEIPKILISLGLDLTVEKRVSLSDLLRHLVSMNHVSRHQVQFAFGRLFSRLDDLSLDVPNASELLREFLRRAVTNGYCDSAAAELMCQGAQLHNYPEEVARVKQIISKIVIDYLASDNDVEEACRSVREMDAPEFGHAVIKKLIYAGIDRSPRERESVSQLLAALSGSSSVNQVEIDKGFQQLVEGLEDVVADIPDVVDYVSAYLARAILDEVIAPSFLTRSQMDLALNDLGKQAIDNAKHLLSLPSAGTYLSAIWDPSRSSELQSLLSDVSNSYLLDGQDAVALRLLHDPFIGPSFVNRLFIVATSRDAHTLHAAQALMERANRIVIKKGIDLVRDRLPDLKIDVPDVEHRFEVVFKGL